MKTKNKRGPKPKEGRIANLPVRILSTDELIEIERIPPRERAEILLEYIRRKKASDTNKV
jgi:hypothetical protein